MLASSYYFYMTAIPHYAILLVFATIVTYVTALFMGANLRPGLRKTSLVTCLVGCLGLLAVFKYAGFFNETVNILLESLGMPYRVPSFNILLPIGISFFTFQSLSYTIDVYRGHREPERHFGIYALYVSFFPQLVAGPIERSTRLLPQFHEKSSFDARRVAMGLQLMLWGVFKKVAIADRLAVVVNQVYSDPTSYQGITLIIATYFFAFQIYCDFSGYSDIAIGAAQVLGYDLMQNFRSPYFAKSIREFWQRWHVSLSTWFRDYLYFTLGGKHVSQTRWYFNIMTVFVISGLWHGASWTFIVWGTIHGCYYAFYVWFRGFGQSIFRFTRLDGLCNLKKNGCIFVTFNFVAFAWIFFRADSISDAFYIASHLFTGLFDFLLNLTQIGQGKNLIGGDLGLSKLELVFAVILVMVLLIVQKIQTAINIRHTVANFPLWLRWSLYYLMIFGTLLFGKHGVQEFIYFQF